MAKRKNTRSKAKSKKVTRKQVADPRGGSGSMTDAQFSQYLSGLGNPAVTSVMVDKYGGQPLGNTFSNVSAPSPMSDFEKMLIQNRQNTAAGENPVTSVMADKYGGQIDPDFVAPQQGGGKSKKAKSTAKKAKRNMDGPRPKTKSPVNRNRDAKGGFGVQEMGSKKSPFRG